MNYINCKEIAQNILDEVKAASTPRGLLIITVGNNPASESYIKGKVRDCEYCGVPCDIERPQTPEELEEAIIIGNMDKSIGGIIVQLPLPNGWDEDYYTSLVSDEKDVDGFKPNSAFAPCTPEGIVHLLKNEIEDLTGKNALIIGRGKLVGKPLIDMLLKENCTVTIAHSKTPEDELISLMKNSNIIISATGKPGLIDPVHGRFGAIYIDAGVSKVDGKLHGDILSLEVVRNMHAKYEFYKEKRLTPVPGGVGLLTRAMLMKHMMEVNK